MTGPTEDKAVEHPGDVIGIVFPGGVEAFNAWMRTPGAQRAMRQALFDSWLRDGIRHGSRPVQGGF
jgi:hypothetical protein